MFFYFPDLPSLTCLSVTKIDIPAILEVGDEGILKCAWKLDGETLYSVKWYQGLREIYRYTPSKKPPIQIFHNDFLQIDVSIQILTL